MNNVIYWILILSFQVISGRNEKSSCSFYCSIGSRKFDHEPSFFMSWMRRLGCSHSIIGPILVDSNLDLHLDDQYTKADWKSAVRVTRGLHSRSNTVKTLLNLKLPKSDFFHPLEDSKLENLTNTLSSIFTFDGFILEIPGPDPDDEFLRFSRRFRDYFKNLQIDGEITSNIGKEGLYQIGELFDNIYINLDKARPTRNTSIFDEYRLVDPLYGNSDVPLNETISGMVEQITSVIRPDKLVFGLSSLARGVIANSRTNWDRGKDWLVEKKGTRKRYQTHDGRFSLQEICEPLVLVPISKDNSTVSSYFLDRNQNWFSFNMPYSLMTMKKIRWLSEHGVGGIGISDVTADDPENECRFGKFPLLRFLSSNFDCRPTITARSHVKRNICGKFLPIL